CIGLLVATFYWRKMASSLRAENRDLLESLESLRQANATDHEVQVKVKELEQAHQFDSYRIQQLEAASLKLAQFSNQGLYLLREKVHLVARVSALENENLTIKHDYEGKPRIPRVGAWMGLTLAPVQGGETAGQAGAVITYMADNGPADRSLLQVGDIILGMDGEPVGNPEDYRRLMLAKLGGEKVSLDVMRSTNRLKIEAIPRDWPQ
ncbi:MAG: hypothetical protein JWM16_1674, partial [Verrucomicrobiales bacterium]|nr:hypothetical protein [Verrucomicrobiales bacterium]